jgi:cell division septal protein FtsQ
VSSVSAPADRRFRRAHVKPSRRRRGWRALALPAVRLGVLAAVAALGFHRLADLTAQARVLQVERIVVRGTARLSRGEVLAALADLRGESLIWTDLDSWRRRILTSPWVGDAELRRSFPSTVEVTITERRPIGLGRLDGGMYLVDEHGVVIDRFGPQYADLDLPIIDGLSVDSGGGPAAADAERANLAARVIGDLAARPEIARRLSQLDVGDVRNAVAILAGDPAAIHLGAERFLQRLQGYLELSEALRASVPEIDYVDLRFDERIYVKPAAHGRGAAARLAAGAKPEIER